MVSKRILVSAGNRPKLAKNISHILANAFLSARGIVREDFGRIPKGPKSADFDQTAWATRSQGLLRTPLRCFLSHNLWEQRMSHTGRLHTDKCHVPLSTVKLGCHERIEGSVTYGKRSVDRWCRPSATSWGSELGLEAVMSKSCVEFSHVTSWKD